MLFLILDRKSPGHVGHLDPKLEAVTMQTQHLNTKYTTVLKLDTLPLVRTTITHYLHLSHVLS